MTMTGEDSREHSTPMRATNRREFLKLAGASALGVAGAAALTSRPGIAEASERTPGVYDVAIIGGGFAGVTAARELSREGFKVVVLEGRDRLGGRTFTRKFEGRVSEFGGTWVHWAQPHVWAELTRYDIPVVESPVMAIERVSWLAKGKLKTAPIAEAVDIIQRALDQFGNVDGAEGLKLFPMPIDSTFTNEYQRFDGQSLAGRLRQLNLSPDEAALVNAWVTVESGNDPSVGGLIDHMRWYRLCDGNYQQMIDRLARYHLRDGMSSLIEAMAKDARAQIELSTPVVRVQQEANLVTIHTAPGSVFKAQVVIVTVPMNTFSKIEFLPTLSEDKRAAAKEKHANRITKFWYKLKERIGFFQGLAPFPNPVTATFTENDEPDGTVLVAFGPPNMVNINDLTSVQAAVRTLIPGATVTKAAGHDWSSDPFSDGAWCWFKPNQMTKYLKALQKREGNCFFASGDSANGWRGFVDGAIESGLRCAREVMNVLHA